MADAAVTDAVAALLRKQDHYRKSGADPAKIAETELALRAAGYDPDAKKADDAKNAKSESKAADVAPEPKTRAVSEDAPKGRTAPPKTKAA